MERSRNLTGPRLNAHISSFQTTIDPSKISRLCQGCLVRFDFGKMTIKLLTTCFMVREPGELPIGFNAPDQKDQSINDRIYQGRVETDVEQIVTPEMKETGLKKEYLRVQLEKLLGEPALVDAAIAGMSPEDADLTEKSKEEIKAIAEEYSTFAKEYAAEIRAAARGEKIDVNPAEANRTATQTKELAHENRIAKFAADNKISVKEARTQLDEEIAAYEARKREEAKKLDPKIVADEAARKRMSAPINGKPFTLGTKEHPMEMPEASDELLRMESRDATMERLAAEDEARAQMEKMRADQLEKAMASRPIPMPEGPGEPSLEINKEAIQSEAEKAAEAEAAATLQEELAKRRGDASKIAG